MPQQGFRCEPEVLFDTFSFKKKYAFFFRSPVLKKLFHHLWILAGSGTRAQDRRDLFCVIAFLRMVHGQPCQPAQQGGQENTLNENAQTQVEKTGNRKGARQLGSVWSWGWGKFCPTPLFLEIPADFTGKFRLFASPALPGERIFHSMYLKISPLRLGKPDQDRKIGGTGTEERNIEQDKNKRA